MAVSAILHLLVFVLWRGAISLPLNETPGSRSPDPAPGGGALQAMNVRLPSAVKIPPPPEPVVAIEAPEIEVRNIEVSLPGPDVTLVAQVAPFPGIVGGEGEGEGGEGFAEDDFISPMPRSIVPHWNPPSSVRGMEVTVRVHVDAHGHPTGEVTLDPPTPDRKFNREIEDRMRRMEYRPASRNGRPVAGWAEITFIF